MSNNEQFKFLSDAEFKELAKEGRTENVGVQKGYSPEVRAVDKEKRVIDFIISTESVDRMGDVIHVSGWQLDNFKENPVVLFGHDHGSPPIGRAIEIRKRPKKKTLEAKAEFMDKDISPFADTIFQMFVNGFMRATSVGFVPMEFEFSQDEDRDMGIDFKKQDLLEFSAVSVPANPEALMGARSKGIDTAPLYNWAEETLDTYEEHKNSGLVIPRKTIEQIRAKADPKQRRNYSVDPERARKLARENLESIDRQSVESVEQDKGPISFSEAHSEGTPKAPKDESWDGPGEIAEASIDDLQVISAWRKDEPTGEDGEFNKSDFKLPHHRAEGDHAVVWRGVTAAAARLPQTDMPEEDVPGVQDHIGKHYAEFDETPPWEEQEDAWKAYVEASADFLDRYKRGLVDTTEDLISLRDAGLAIFDEVDVKSVIDEIEDRYAIDKAEIDWPSKSVEEKDEDEEIIEIDNTPIEKEVETDVDEDKDSGKESLRSAETDSKDLSEDKDADSEDEVETDKTIQVDPYTVAESLLEMMELTFDMVEQDELDIDEFLNNRRGRRVLNNIIDVSKDFSEVLKVHFDKQLKSETDSVDSEDKDHEPEDYDLSDLIEIEDEDTDNTETKDVDSESDDEDEEIDLDDISSDEIKTIVREEISNITREEIEKKKRELRGSPD